MISLEHSGSEGVNKTIHPKYATPVGSFAMPGLLRLGLWDLFSLVHTVPSPTGSGFLI